MPSVVGRGHGHGTRCRVYSSGSSASGRTETLPASAFEASSAQRSDPSRSAALVIQLLPSTAGGWATDGSQTKMHRRRRAACRRRRPSGRPAAGGSRRVRRVQRARAASCSTDIAGAPTVELANPNFDYVEIFHNRQRRHSSLGMLTPIDTRTDNHPSRHENTERDSTKPGAGHSRSTTRPKSSSTYSTSQPPQLRHRAANLGRPSMLESDPQIACATTVAPQIPERRARQPCARLGSHGGH
jgi:hypothetical protein